MKTVMMIFHKSVRKSVRRPEVLIHKVLRVFPDRLDRPKPIFIYIQSKICKCLPIFRKKSIKMANSLSSLSKALKTKDSLQLSLSESLSAGRTQPSFYMGHRRDAS